MKLQKYKLSLSVLGVVLVAGMVAQARPFGTSSAETKGTVKRFLMNPEGTVDGFLLDNGNSGVSQINFPPHMASQLTAIVAANDSVTVKGFKENEKVFKAETVTNTKTEKSITETPPKGPPPQGPDAGIGANPPPPPPPGPGPKHGPREGLKELTAQGKIENQLYGRRGEVNGVVLADGTIVHFGPRFLNNSKVKMDVGLNLKVLGFGTQTANGQSIEATDVSNQN